ncbi:MAG: Transporter, LysE family [uncultured Paraburkholderia sp.]|nr:MAG: Transporter, LysE family [uncultured Paraburkholderia sp.]
MSTTAWLFFLPACFAINLAPGPNNLLSINVAARHGFATAFLGDTGRLVAFAGMIVLAIQLWRSDAPAIDITRDESASLAKVARQEFLVAAGNPKAILVFTAFLPQFVDIARPMLPQFAVLGASFLVLECVAIALYSWTGMHLGKWLVRARVRRWFNRCCGAFLAAIGVSFLLVRRA